MENKTQHWIPKSYTKAWADPYAPKNRGKVVHLYERETGKYIGWRYPPGVFSLPDLYTRKGPKGERDISIEKMLNRVETQFERTKRRLLAKRKIENRDRTAIAAYVSAMHERTPRMRDHHKEQLNNVVQLGDRMAKAFERASPKQRERMARATKASLVQGPSISLEEMRRIAGSDFGRLLPQRLSVIAPHLAGMGMAVLHTADQHGFITSDSPVVYWLADDQGLLTKRPFGLKHPKIEITMPISPSACIYITHFDIEPEHLDISPERVTALNMRTLHRCDKTFVANSDKLTVEWQD